MSVIAGILVALGGVFCVGLAALIWMTPAWATRFLMGFASSAPAHFMEQSARLLFGMALLVRSPSMRHASFFHVAGWAIVISTLVLLLMPWHWHHRLAQRALPFLVRHMKLYAIGSLGFGVLLLYALLAPGA
jgi:hypothetical protein